MMLPSSSCSSKTAANSSSRRRRRRRRQSVTTTTCQGKISGEPLLQCLTEQQASEQAMTRNNQKHGKQIHAYRCQTCDYWHLAPNLPPPKRNGDSDNAAATTTTNTTISNKKNDDVAFKPTLQRSTTCCGKKSGAPLLEFSSELEAQEQANHDTKKYGGKPRESYQCSVCDKWHLGSRTGKDHSIASPPKSKTCSEKGFPRPLTQFQNEADARAQADSEAKKYRKPMHAYHCRICDKWHVGRRHETPKLPPPQKSMSCFGSLSDKPLLEFDTESNAKTQADIDAKRYKRRPMRPYRCQLCDKWHLARTKPRALPTSTKSTSCLSHLGQMLSEYTTAEEASMAAKRHSSSSSDPLGETMVPYQCLRCRKWHISPADRHTQSRPWCDFSCRDSNGKLKDAYYTCADAERRADIILEENNRVQLRAYQCPKSTMWHLTHT